VKLLVRNIDREITQQQLASMFEKYGKIQYCTLVEDKVTGKHKGFGFVEMPKSGEAKAAIKNLNGSKLNGTVLRVKKAEPSAKTKPDVVTKNKSDNGS
jgi:RNA recognition motif-containing protein